MTTGFLQSREIGMRFNSYLPSVMALERGRTSKGLGFLLATAKSYKLQVFGNRCQFLQMQPDYLFTFRKLSFPLHKKTRNFNM